MTTALEKAAAYVLAPFESTERLLASLSGAITSFTDLQSKTGWLYLLTSGLVAVAIHAVGRRRGWIDPQSLARFLFPREVWLHRSAIADYKFVAVDLTIKMVVYVPLVAGLSMLVYKTAAGAMGSLMPEGMDPGKLVAGTVLVPLLALIVADFGFFLSHYLMHRIPLLWPFHEVHHSAEVLTPVTVYRTHPVEDLVNAVVAAVFSGAGAALYTSATRDPVSLPTLLGVNVVQLAFFSFAFQLRHSHVWLSYGPFLSRIFISPAQHQIHHSTDPKHWDRNYGFMLAIWDALFRSLYVPRSREKLTFGVPGADPQDFATVPRLYFLPFVKAMRRLRAGVATPSAPPSRV